MDSPDSLESAAMTKALSGPAVATLRIAAGSPLSPDTCTKSVFRPTGPLARVLLDQLQVGENAEHFRLARGVQPGAHLLEGAGRKLNPACRGGMSPESVGVLGGP